MTRPSETETRTLAGVWPVLVTPFDSNLSIIDGDLVRQVEWLIDSGAHGLVYPGVASEFFTLRDDERRNALRTVIRATQGRVGVVAGVSAPSAPYAAALADDAAEAGACAVMAMMPYVQHFFAPSAAFARTYYESIAAAGPLPIVLQNARIGHVLSPTAIAELVKELPAIRYVKEESFPNTHALSEVIAAVGASVDGVFGGIGGVYLAQELRRGAVGTMPAPGVADALVAAYNLWNAGDESAAEAITTELRHFFLLELLYNVSFIKAVLAERGIISTAITRVPSPRMDEVDTIDVTEITRCIRAVADRTHTHC